MVDGAGVENMTAIRPNEWDAPMRLVAAELIAAIDYLASTGHAEAAFTLSERLVHKLLSNIDGLTIYTDEDVLDFLEWWYTKEPRPERTIES